MYLQRPSSLRLRGLGGQRDGIEHKSASRNMMVVLYLISSYLTATDLLTMLNFERQRYLLLVLSNSSVR
jgi:hypothetical protein